MIVGFGTSLPEFLIGVQAASTGYSGLAHGNIIGSNIANIFLVLALPALIFPIATDAHRMRITAFFMLCCTAAWIGVTMFFGLTQIVGMIFLVAVGPGPLAGVHRGAALQIRQRKSGHAIAAIGGAQQ